MAQTQADRQRLDKWLWHARMARTRSAAASLVTDGHVRLNGERCIQSSKSVRIGDVLTIALAHDVRLLRVAGIAARRGCFDVARSLYADLAADDA